MVGIYKITSPTNKIYIGQSWNIKKRINHYNALLCEGQSKLYASLKKYGFKNHKFEVIHELPLDVEQCVLDTYEIFYWEMHKECGFETMNLKEPGKGGKHSEETKNKMRKPKSKIHGQKISLAKKGVKLSKDHIDKIILYQNRVDVKQLKSNLWKGDKNPTKNLEILEKMKIIAKEVQNRDHVKAKKSIDHSGPQPVIECPHCSQKGGVSNMNRYHFNNCKNKNNE